MSLYGALFGSVSGLHGQPAKMGFIAYAKDTPSELTGMIVAQRAYRANSQMIETADGLLDQLNEI